MKRGRVGIRSRQRARNVLICGEGDRDPMRSATEDLIEGRIETRRSKQKELRKEMEDEDKMTRGKHEPGPILEINFTE